MKMRTIFDLLHVNYDSFRVIKISEILIDKKGVLNFTQHAAVILIDDCPLKQKQLILKICDYVHINFFVCTTTQLDESRNLSLSFEVGGHAQCHVMFAYSGNGSFSAHAVLDMQGMHAQVSLHAIYVCYGTGGATLKVEQKHSAESTTSSVVMRTVVEDAALCSYEGMIVIAQDACLSNAQQEHKALLMSSQARAIALPQLEVLTNDVQCGHGSAIGLLNEEQLWYMQTRGFSIEKAREILIQNFIMQAIPDWLYQRSLQNHV